MNISVSVGSDNGLGDIVVALGNANIYDVITFGLACAIFAILLLDVIGKWR